MAEIAESVPADIWAVALDVYHDVEDACIDQYEGWEPKHDPAELIARAILAERERCASLCEMTASRHGWNYNLPSVGREMADRIRSPLSNTEGTK